MELPLTIQEAAAALRVGQITSVELTRTLLDKIETLLLDSRVVEFDDVVY